MLIWSSSSFGSCLFSSHAYYRVNAYFGETTVLDFSKIGVPHLSLVFKWFQFAKIDAKKAEEARRREKPVEINDWEEGQRREAEENRKNLENNGVAKVD